MKHSIAAFLAMTVLATSAFADSHTGVGDPAKGEKEFGKCKACHMIQDADGNTIVKGGRTGPNLYGVIGRQAGSVEDFRYGTSLIEAGDNGLVWDEETFVAYIQDPANFLKSYLDDNKARSKMSFRMRKGAADVYAYLVSVGPQM